MAEKSIEQLKKELKLKEQIKTLEAEIDKNEDNIVKPVVSFLIFLGICGYSLFKKPEGWLWLFLIFFGLGLIMLMFGMLFYFRIKKGQRKLTRLKKELAKGKD